MSSFNTRLSGHQPQAGSHSLNNDSPLQGQSTQILKSEPALESSAVFNHPRVPEADITLSSSERKSIVLNPNIMRRRKRASGPRFSLSDVVPHQTPAQAVIQRTEGAADEEDSSSQEDEGSESMIDDVPSTGGKYKWTNRTPKELRRRILVDEDEGSESTESSEETTDETFRQPAKSKKPGATKKSKDAVLSGRVSKKQTIRHASKAKRGKGSHVPQPLDSMIETNSESQAQAQRTEGADEM